MLLIQICWQRSSCELWRLRVDEMQRQRQDLVPQAVTRVTPPLLVTFARIILAALCRELIMFCHSVLQLCQRGKEGRRSHKNICGGEH